MSTLTAAQRREAARSEYNAYIAHCPSRRLFATLSNKWVMLVICLLGEHDMRYSEISNRLAGVSQKMLTQTLRQLERDGLVSRTVTPSVPVRVDYALTALGRSLLDPISHVKAWAEVNMVEVDAAREEYDATRD